MIMDQAIRGAFDFKLHDKNAAQNIEQLIKRAKVIQMRDIYTPKRYVVIEL
jgi:ATP-dependent Clp protease adapter protein ClpS